MFKSHKSPLENPCSAGAGSSISAAGQVTVAVVVRFVKCICMFGLSPGS